ncbi:hypothetical protein AAG565_15580 [Fontimonas sp. SYSU GA230001]|uniref:hypothetical protein n=1 Tax=Fontimonas sp. SYSU GA230001 TaxID=3142450 RepID=UPI0032B52705
MALSIPLHARASPAAPEVVIDYPWYAPLAKKAAPPGVKVIAFPYAVDLDSRRDGVWTTSGDVRRWALSIRVPGASSLAAELSFTAVPGAKLSAGREILLRSKQRYVTAHTGTETIMLVMTAPARGGDPHLAITGLRIADAPIVPKSSERQFESYDCHRTPENEPNARAVAEIMVGGYAMCSATLINNRAGEDGAARPLLITADHCKDPDVEPESSAQNIRVYWRAEVPCGDPRTGDYSALDVYQSEQSGARHVFSVASNDIWLVELNGWPREQANAWLAGYDARDQAPQGVVYGIHHGGAAPKQYLSSPKQYVYRNVYRDEQTGNCPYTYCPDLRVDVDTMAEGSIGQSWQGSSGSGLFSSEHLYLGTLQGGVHSDDVEYASYHAIGGAWTVRGLGGVLEPADPQRRRRDGEQPPFTGEMTLNLTASATLIESGQSVTLSWEAANAQDCVADGSWTGAKPLSGSETFSPPTGSYSYSLYCTAPLGGAMTRTVSVDVTEPTGGGGGLSWTLLALFAGAAARRRAGKI